MARFAFGSLVSLLALSLAACGGSPSGSGTPSPSATGTTPGTAAPSTPQMLKQHGTIIDFGSQKPVAGATVTANDSTTTTDAKGNFDLPIPANEAFEMNVTAPSYVKLVQQQTTLTGDYDSGNISLVPMSLEGLLQDTLSGYDATLGVLSISVLPTGGCQSEAGATIDFSPKGAGQLRYVANGLPTATATAVSAGQLPSAVIYNLQPNVPITVTVTSPTCTQSAFPVATPQGITYFASVATEPGNVTAFQRLFLQ